VAVPSLSWQVIVSDSKNCHHRYSLAVVGALDVENNNSSSADVTSDAHRALARRLAANAAVLLQNEGGALPLNLQVTQKETYAVAMLSVSIRKKVQFPVISAKALALPLPLQRLKAKGHGSIALIGEKARDKPLFGGGGSGSVVPKSPVTIYAALAQQFGQVKKTGKRFDSFSWLSQACLGKAWFSCR
jgi:beta-glucosidase-like glycosyl hydrolase